jgi:hypothetical protein
MSIKNEAACAKAVKTLIEWQGGNIAELARVAGVSRVGAFKWQKAGKVSEPAAALLSRLNGCPLSFAEIRPDLDATVTQKYAGKDMTGYVKSQNAYMKERDRAAKEKAKGAAKPASTRTAKRVKE